MVSIKRILCPTDLSAESDAALRYAVALAQAYQAGLFICHCTDPASFVDTLARDNFQERFEAAIKPYTTLADETASRCEGIIIEGDPDLAISRVAAERFIDLIVMRSRRRPLAAALLGSTAEAVCRTAPCPVLVTHPQEHEWAGLSTGEVALKKILVAHDFSNDSELALQYAISLAQEYQTELHLMHVLPVTLAPATTGLPLSIESDFQRAARLLQQAVPDETHLWCKVVHAVRAGQPYREILTYAEEQEIDLICMGVHGAGFAMRALFGSNADRVLRQSSCPVLIARPLKPFSEPDES